MLNSQSEAAAVLAPRRFDLIMPDYDLGEGGRGDEITRSLLSSEHRGTTVIIHSIVQRALGHGQITATEIYARVSDDALRRAAGLAL